MKSPQGVRDDLIFAVKTPEVWSIYDDELESLFTYSEQQLQQLIPKEQDWVPYYKKWFSSTRSLKLGYYYEQLLACYFDLHPQVEKFWFNLQLYEGKQTIGAPDFIIQFKNNDEYLLHVEVALKFYLCTNKVSEPQQWLGPSTKDYFGKKRKKLLTHQLAMGKHADLQKRFEGKTIKSCGRIAGRMYYRLQKGKLIQAPSPLFKEHHPKGWWCKAEEALANFNRHYFFAPLQKLEWFSPPNENKEFVSANKAKDLAAKRPQHFALFYSEDGLQFSYVSHGFIVPNYWPQPA